MDEEERKLWAMKGQIKQRFKEGMRKEGEDPKRADKRPAKSQVRTAHPRSDTDSNSSVQVTQRTITAKAMPGSKSRWQKKSDKPDSAAMHPPQQLQPTPIDHQSPPTNSRSEILLNAKRASAPRT